MRQDNSAGRQELAQSFFGALHQLSEGTRDSLRTQNEALASLREGLDRQLALMTQTSDQKAEALRATLEGKLAAIQQDNNAKLEQMRATVEEKLQTTLERRLGDSFKIVSENLQQVHLAMGEMRKLAGEIGSLQTLMSNVKNRGGWGEFQLGAILEQFLSPEQYAKNVRPRGHGETVEFAIKLPGRDLDGTHVWLPIDAKFPKEDYEKLLAAIERRDIGAGSDFDRPARIADQGERTGHFAKVSLPAHDHRFRASCFCRPRVSTRKSSGFPAWQIASSATIA